MELDKYHVHVMYPGSDTPVKREVEAIDFRTDTFLLVTEDGTETVDASLVTPLDARGRPRRRFNFNLGKGLNIYSQPLPDALANIDRIIATYEATEGVIAFTTYKKALEVKESLLRQTFDVLSTHAEDIVAVVGGARTEDLISDAPATDDTTKTPVIEVHKPETRLKRELRGLLAAAKVVYKALGGRQG